MKITLYTYFDDNSQLFNDKMHIFHKNFQVCLSFKLRMWVTVDEQCMFTSISHISKSVCTRVTILGLAFSALA